MTLVETVSTGPPPLTEPARRRTVVLDADSGFRSVVSGGDLDRARAASVAHLLGLPTGAWHPPRDGLAPSGYGHLILSGAMLRSVGVDGRFGGELLGPGDLVHPSQDGAEEQTVPYEVAWTVVRPAALAVLDARWANRMAAFPAVTRELTGRTLERSRRLATMMAIAQQPRLDRRLWLLLWELADRFGVVRRDGVHLSLPLTHATLAQLAAARRPSVSAALGRLAVQGIVGRAGRDWVLHGEPPILTRVPDHDAFPGHAAAV